MPDRYMTMRRTAGGILVPDHTPEAKPKEQAPKPTPSSVLKLNRKLRRRLGKPWKGRKMARDLARRQAAEAIKAGTVGVARRKEEVKGCAEDCDCKRVRGGGAGHPAAGAAH